MKKICKVLVLVLAFLTFGLIKAKAETTVVGDKKYTITPIETEEKFSYLFKVGDKTYAIYDSTSDSIEDPGEEPETIVYEAKFGEDKITLTKDFDLEKLMTEVTEKFGTKQYVYYAFSDFTRKFTKVTETMDDSNEEEVESYMDTLEDDGSYYRHYGPFNGKFYIVKQKGFNRTIIVLNKDLTLDKTINCNELMTEVLKDEEFGIDEVLVTGYLNDADPYYAIGITVSGETDIKKAYIFDAKGELYTIIDDSDADSGLEYSLTPVYSNKEIKFFYSKCTYENEKYSCELNLYNKEGKELSLLKADGSIVAGVYKGFVLIHVFTVDSYKFIVYDNDLNKIVETDTGGEVYEEMTEPIEMTERYVHGDYLKYKEVQNGVYLYKTYEYPENAPIITKYYYVTVEDAAKTTISGVLKDKDGNPLKNHTVELHSTPRTVVTDKNGYFEFKNVEEGDHTLTIKDTNGEVLAVKEIKVLPSTETKIEGDTLYFKEGDKGLSIDLKIDGTTLKVAEKEETKEEAKEETTEKKTEVTESVPKTNDALYLYILLLGIFSIIGIKVYKKITV